MKINNNNNNLHIGSGSTFEAMNCSFTFGSSNNASGSLQVAASNTTIINSMFLNHAANGIGGSVSITDAG